MRGRYMRTAGRRGLAFHRAASGVLLALALAFALALVGTAAATATAAADGEPALLAQADHGQQQTAGAHDQPAAHDPPAAHDQPAAHGVESAGAGHGGHRNLGAILPLWAVIPFVGILLSIALFPLLAPHFWHHHFPKVSAFWALVFAVPFLIAFKGDAFYEILHIYLIDYIPFIILLASLFTASGGILLRGSPAGSPKVNVVFLAIGTLLASMIGTTGASMLLIRPLLRANAKRRTRVHIVVFFIFLVSNIGGSLTPLGDPPLFLGFLHGVPFFWTLKLVPEMAFIAGLILAVFFLWDTLLYNREKAGIEKTGPSEPLRIEGAHNFLYLLGVLGGVILSGMWHAGSFTLLGVHLEIQNIARDLILISMAVLAYVTTKAQTRKDNEFTWFPIKEVAFLFAGIFMTIIPALAILKAGEHGALAGLIRSVKEPWHYFWAAGGLSSFLDNAPTYLTFFNSALGKFYSGVPEREAVLRLIAENGIYLKGIALGAVYMGANTYIGNAPNFMVRSIAEEVGVPMPSFFGYMIKFSIPILIPLFVLVTLVFMI
jgi:Na+/H+ antiporter NhaD/arsenite permease-like protein